MSMLRKSLLTLAMAGLTSAMIGALGPASADDTATEAPAVTEPVAPEATGDAAAVVPEATGETASEVAPSSGTGTAEEPPYSVMPSEGPGGGCHGHGVEDPSV